jgi:hypothetical protein
MKAVAVRQAINTLTKVMQAVCPERSKQTADKHTAVGYYPHCDLASETALLVWDSPDVRHSRLDNLLPLSADR